MRCTAPEPFQLVSALCCRSSALRIESDRAAQHIDHAERTTGLPFERFQGNSEVQFALHGEVVRWPSRPSPVLVSPNKIGKKLVGPRRELLGIGWDSRSTKATQIEKLTYPEAVAKRLASIDGLGRPSYVEKLTSSASDSATLAFRWLGSDNRVFVMREQDRSNKKQVFATCEAKI